MNWLNETRLKIVEIATLTTWNNAKFNMRARDARVRDVKFIESFLTIVYKMKKFSNREMIFSIDIILKKRRIITSINFEIENAIHISSTFVILDNDEFARFLTLIKQKVVDHMIKMSNVKDEMNFYKFQNFNSIMRKFLSKTRLIWKKFIWWSSNLTTRQTILKFLTFNQIWSSMKYREQKRRLTLTLNS